MIFYSLAYALCSGISAIFFPLRIRGRHQLSRRKGFILASNHVSHLDPVLLGYCARRKLSFMAKDSLFKNPIFGQVIRTFGAFPLKREKADIGALKEAIDRLEKGNGLVIFPQGTRLNSVDKTTKAHPGVGFLVSKTHVPVIPAYIDGSDKVLAPKAKHLTRHRVTIIIGEPMTFPKTLSHQEIADRILAAIVALKPK